MKIADGIFSIIVVVGLSIVTGKQIGQNITNMIGELSAKWYSMTIEEQKTAIEFGFSEVNNTLCIIPKMELNK